MPNHLIFVPGVAVLRQTAGDLSADAAWYLDEHEAGNGARHVEQLKRAVELAAADPEALLVLTGRASERSITRTQSISSKMVAEAQGWWGAADVAKRTHLEEFARDSFEHLLFSLARYREAVRLYPERITVITWAYKAAMFDLHRRAIRWPLERFRFEGRNNPAKLGATEERERSVEIAYLDDPYAAGPKLRQHRRDRNPWLREPGYHKTAQEMKELLGWEGPKLFRGPLPWDALRA